MSVELDTQLVELTQRGATAALLLESQRLICGRCVEEVLKTIDREVLACTMTPEKALAMVSEIAAFRRIVYRQEQQVQVGRVAQERLAQESKHG